MCVSVCECMSKRVSTQESAGDGEEKEMCLCEMYQGARRGC